MFTSSTDSVYLVLYSYLGYSSLNVTINIQYGTCPGVFPPKISHVNLTDNFSIVDSDLLIFYEQCMVFQISYEEFDVTDICESAVISPMFRNQIGAVGSGMG